MAPNGASSATTRRTLFIGTLIAMGRAMRGHRLRRGRFGRDERMLRPLRSGCLCGGVPLGLLDPRQFRLISHGMAWPLGSRGLARFVAPATKGRFDSTSARTRTEHAVIQDPNTRTKTCIHRQSCGRRLGQGQAATVARRNLSATEARRPGRHYPPSRSGTARGRRPVLVRPRRRTVSRLQTAGAASDIRIERWRRSL